MLVVDGDRRREGPHHRRYLWGPDPAGVHDLLGFDGPASVTTRRTSSRSPSSIPVTRVPVRMRTPSSRPEAATAWVAMCGIDVSVSRHPDRAVQRLRAGRRHEPDSFLGRDQIGLQPDPAGPADAAPQLEQALRAGGHPQASHGLEHAELSIELDAVASEAHHRRRGVELGDESSRMVGRAARQLALLEEQHVA